MKASLPQPNVPLVDASFTIGSEWYQSLVKLLNRTGGTATDLVAQSLRASSTGIVVSTDPTVGGTVTRSLAAGTGLSVTNADGTLGNPAFALANTAVTPNPYGDSTHVGAFTVDAQGRLTAASSVAIAYPVTSVFGRTGAVVAATNDYSFSQISGSLAGSQTPAYTGDVTKAAGSTTTVLASIPAISGVNLTALNASNLSTGTMPSARLSYGSSAGTVAQGNDSRFPATASSSWTPSDASGAGLAITSAHHRYTQIGPYVFITCTLTYPATADVTAAQVGGLPVTILNESGVGGSFVIYNGAAAIGGFPVVNGTSFTIGTYAGVPTTNADLSGKTLRFQFMYPVA